MKKGAPRSKLLVGVPFYGQSFTLAYPNGQKDQGVNAADTGDPGEFTKQPGMLAYYEICYRIRSQQWTVKEDAQGATGPYSYKGDQWVGYDDVDSVRKKAEYIVKQGFGGAVAWTVDLDDFLNRCCKETFPLLKSLNRGLGLLKGSAPVGDCTKPPEPVTPPAPTLTTGVDTGAASTPAMSSTTWPTWEPTPGKVTTTSTTTTPKPVTWWSSTAATPTTTSPWWTTSSTQKTTTTTKPATTTKKPQSTTIPVPAVIMPVNDPIEGPSCDTGTYQADPLNCNAYYRCVLGELRKEYCAGGLHWNKERNICDWPNMARCEEKGTITTTTTTTTKRPKTTTTTSRSTTTTRGTTTTKKSTKRPESVKPTEGPSVGCTSGQYYAHEFCDHFYICVNGKKVQQRCGPGLHWNVDKGSCDWAFKVNCKREKVFSRFGPVR